MAIAFSEIPSNWRVPLAWAEFNASQATTGPSVKTYQALIMGQKVAAGTKAELEIFPATNLQTVKNAAGAGSQLAAMAEKWFANNTTIAADFVCIDDHASGVAATGSIALTGPSTAAGTLDLWIAGRQYAIAVASGDSATTIGDAIDTAVAADADARVTTANTTGTVAVTAKNDGTNGNEIDIRVNYSSGAELPAGVGVTITPMASGATNPSVTEIIDILGEKQYDFIVCPWTDATNFGLLDAELLDRWGALRSIEGGAFMAINDSHADLITYGTTANSPYISVLGRPTQPTPGDETAAAYAGQMAKAIANDPARPAGTLRLIGVYGPEQSEEFTNEENNLLLNGGIATAYSDSSGNVRVQRSITTYQTDALGADDTAFLDMQTLYTLGYIRYDWRTHMGRYATYKVANDGTRFAPGQLIVTPKIVRSEACNKFREWESIGLVEDFDAFKADLIVERNSGDPTRIDVYMPPNIVNPLTVIASVIGFRL